MYRTKKDVDKHVENLIAKLSVKEFKTRAYSIGRLYYEVGDYSSCQKYVEQYLTQKDNNAAAHKLLGQALQKLGQKEKALEHYKISLDIDPTQTSTILDICELLADDEVDIDPGRAKYWCEKAEATFPRHPITFRLRERLVTVSNPDPEALVKLLTAELAVRPKDAILHCRLLKHYQHTNQIKQAFEHSFNTEFGWKRNHFNNNYMWYDTLVEILKHNSHNPNDWQYQLLLLTVRERICVLSLTETPSGSAKSLIESNDLLHAYDQALEQVAKARAPPGFGEFHAALLQHHRGQFVLHTATYLLKKAKKDQLSWRDAIWSAAPLMLIAWQTVPLDSKVNWLTHAPEKLQIAVNRWYIEGSYRCSQSGHYLLGNISDRSQSFLDRISQCCSGHWKDKLYEKIFGSKDHLAKIKTSHFVTNAYTTPVLRLPRRIEVEAYDVDAQREYPTSLHHFVWTILNYKNFAHFKCTLFDMLTPTASNCGPETLNKLDVHAFLYCAALTTRQQKSVELSYISSDKPSVIPANITDLLCPLSQMKWWDCAYKFSQNELGTELTDIRATLSRGIEVVRCVDHHGLDPELLCTIGSIFREKAKLTTSVEEKMNLEIRAGLYYSSALPLLEKLKNKMTIKMPEKRLFDYTHKELSLKELNSLIEESKLYVAISHLNDGDYEKVIELLSSLKSPQAYYHLAYTYSKIAMEEKNLSRDHNAIDTKTKYATLMINAKSYAYKALDRVKETEINKDHPLYSQIQQLIEDVETNINKIDPELSINNDGDGKYSSDENISSGGSEHVQIRNNYQIFRNISSTPKQQSNSNLTQYRTAVDSQILQEPPRADSQFLEKIENQIKNFQMRLADDLMEQTKTWFEENRRLGNQIMNTIQSDIQNTTDQFKLLKVSVDHIKDQINECRNECKDVGDLRKQIAELKKEVNKLKKASTEQTIDDNDLYNLDEDYRTSENASTFATQLPFQTSQVMPPFNQRLVPPFPVPSNPYQLYNQSLYNLYNQYSQFGQTSGAPPLFDPTRTPINYPGVYPNPDQMYLDVAHLVPPSVPAVPTVPTVTPVPTVPPVPTMSSAATAPVNAPPPIATVAKPKPSSAVEPKDIPRSLPVNVVITSSDPLPTCTTAPPPILSVTIPPKHIKANATPHNYQIPMPSGNDTTVMSPPVFSFPGVGNKPVSTPSTLINWGQPSVFKTTQANNNTSATGNDSFLDLKNDTHSKSFVDGSFTGISPNTSFNKSRTLSERSNTSVENYDPCPDFKPIIPLPAEVKVTTGEEDETVIFSSRAKLFRFVDKQWKERGIGEIKLLKHKITGKVRVLMRREQIHKICANHVITPDMEIKPMKNETKAYFWVANDFADETVVLEKFCIRFKTADIAQQFSDIFEKSRLDSKNLLEGTNQSAATTTAMQNPLETERTPIAESKSEQSSTPVKPVFGFSYGTPQNKTEFGGFTFNSIPTFKTVPDNPKSDSKTDVPTTTKVNVFSNLNIAKPNTSSPFSNIFSTTTGPVVFSNSQTPKQETPNKLNASDTVEEFEPNVDFKPVVPLPALIDQKTGEEDETVLFEHRAKLLRFDANSKEWKERGLGNIKILAHKDNPQKVRLLMRREQIMKVCCNHAVTNDLVFQKMPNMDKAVTWCAKDFSEGELVAETFCLRFKTVQACDDFMDTLKSVQSKMKDDSKAAKEEQNEAKLNNKVGFGDKFKPKAGSWYCETCYTNNLESFAKCACCEQPNPQSNVKEATTNEPTVAAAAWGDKFKPKVGSWECNGCFIRNEANIDHCPACHTPKEPGMPKIDSSVGAPSENTFKFKFGIPSQTTASAAPVAPLTSLGFGPKFNFGTPLTANNATEQTSKVETTSIFDGTGAHKFSFGIPTATSEQRSSVFGPKVSPAYETLINVPATPSHDKNQPIATVKPALLPTPQADTEAFGVKDAGTFDFKFKPKTPPKGKSPMKSPKSQGDESDEYASEDEGHHIYFSPVVPMPDKVEVVTGEENEIELYGHRAKLFRFIAGEWKERGIGIVKILKHKDTGKLRIVMRREQVLKICLNHALTPEILYSPKDDKTWLFAANDFSEGELSLQQFCLRFKTKEIALEFKEAIDNARDGKLAVKNESHSTKVNDSEDVVFVSEILATDDEKQKAKELMLPENFFTYKTKEPCQGCRGCMNDDEKSIHSTSSFSLTSRTTPFTSSLSTPVKSLPTAFQSPINSFYGTPANFDKTSDTSIFRTPLGSIGSNANSVSPVTPTNAAPANDTKNKENAFTQKNIFAGFGDKQNIFGQSQNTSSNIFGASESQITNAKSSILAPPKLGTQTSQFDNKPEETKSIFGTSQPKVVFGTTQSKPEETKPVFFGTSQSKTEENKSVFDTPQLGGESKSIFGNNNSGVSINESIFSFSSDNKKDDAQEPEVKSLFGGDSKPVNLFSSGHRGSLFGPGALSENQQKPNKVIFGSSAESIFGSNSAQPQNFGSGASVFNIAATGTQAPTWTFGGATNQQKPDMMKTPITATTENKTEETVESAAPETPFKVDNSLSFAALSSSGSGFNVQKNTDFQWEGAGQQLFTSAQKSAKDTDKSANESGAGDDSVAGAEEEYDPHYEPIVPLPDKIVVTTGEEDEVKLFGERCKLYRYDDKTREWKERGVGEMKVLYHPERKTYRFLLRREQVHKAVLNMLLFMDLELLPMKNSDRAWTWAGRNFAENPSGEQETLAVLFKSVELATNFRDKVNECIRKLQAAAAEAIREDVEKPVEPLRLPKGLQDSARADPAMSTKVTEVTDSQSKDQTDGKQNGQMKTELFKQVQFQEPQEDPDEEVYDHEYDYDYYNDEDEESATYYACDGEVLVRQGNSETACENAHVQLLFDQEIYSPKILVTDNDTGEILADMLIHTETEFQLNETSCTWSGTDYTSNDPVDKTVTMDFHDLETALTFYDSCETSKGATYSSTDPES